ncbi:MAG: helix-turn-helix domain-containing protein [Flammeovirgaceae bacterium]
MKTFLSDFSKVIKNLRHEKGFSQEAMAYELGMSPSGYGKIERGETDLTISKIDEIARCFGLTATSIIRIVDEQNSIELSPDSKNLSKEQLFEAYKTLSATVIQLQENVSSLTARLSNLEKKNG